MNEKLLTIVIAAYNKENLLPRCLDSLIVPSVMDEVEVLVVNDGSKDATLQVAREYEKRFPGYFIVVDKQNGNYGSVMNRGLSMARGKYFRTLDADDWYDPSVYEKYIEQLRITDADLVLSERLEVKEKSNWSNRVAFDQDVTVYQDLTVGRDLWKNKSILSVAYVMGFAYKTEMIRRSQLSWTEGIFYTDAEYCVWPLPSIKTIRFVPLPLYVYVRDVDGQSTNLNLRHRNFGHYVKVSYKVLNYYLNNQNAVDVLPLIEKFIVVDLLDNVYPTLFLDGSLYQAEIAEIESLVHKSQVIYERTNRYHHYRNIMYVDYYRHNKLRYWMVRADYLLRSNKILRRIVKRQA